NRCMPAALHLLSGSSKKSVRSFVHFPPGGTRRREMRAVAFVLGTLVGAVLLGHDAHAACNLIPSAAKTFRGALGATNRPFAGPGDFVEVAVDPTRCDAASPGFGADGSDHVVTIVFTPSGGQARVVFLTAAACTSGATKALRQACESAP